jgi:hypothetical protein
MCFGFALLYITAGLSSIFNAATPLFGAAIAWAWLKDRLSPARTLGLLVGFVGVFGLAWSKATLKAGAGGFSVVLAILACLVATLCYGSRTSYTRSTSPAWPPMVVAAGSQLGAALVLIVPAVALWPSKPPGAAAWFNVLMLAVLCTASRTLSVLQAHRPHRAGERDHCHLPGARASPWRGRGLPRRDTDVADGRRCAVILLGTSLATGCPHARAPHRQGRPAPGSPTARAGTGACSSMHVFSSPDMP